MNNEIYILGDFNINLYLDDSYLLDKRNISNSIVASQFQTMLKATMNFALFRINTSNKSPNKDNI